MFSERERIKAGLLRVKHACIKYRKNGLTDDFSCPYAALMFAVYAQAVRDVLQSSPRHQMTEDELRSAHALFDHGSVIAEDGTVVDILGALGIDPDWAKRQMVQAMRA